MNVGLNETDKVDKVSRVRLNEVDKVSHIRLKSDMRFLKKIRGMDSVMRKMTDAELVAQTVRLKESIKKGVPENRMLPEAFAVMTETADRILGLRAYDEQLLGGIELWRGRIAELATGEGKSLMALFPAYLNSVSGKHTHIITVNEYLADRDAEMMKPVFDFLGISSGCIRHSDDRDTRRDVYSSDVIYAVGSEIGFDLMRDGMVHDISDRVLPVFDYAIIDEADSVMIDDADVPLVISGTGEDRTAVCRFCDMAVSALSRGNDTEEFTKADAMAGRVFGETGDYSVSAEDRQVHLTDAGLMKIRNMPGFSDYPEGCSQDVIHALHMALTAYGLFQRDRDYVVRDGRVVIVDSNTGRLLEGRRYSDGLHQALEAKEGLDILPDARVCVSMTYQTLFNTYRKKSGMTGTAYTARNEFRQVYGMKVTRVPTHEPVRRSDGCLRVYRLSCDRWNAVADEITVKHAAGQPVLVGTGSVADSEMLAELLTDRGIECNVLNAVRADKEAEIIAHAGETGMVTIATNMAGRGVDIRPDGNALALGGLCVICAELNGSERIDMQLKGRTGRQGDTGETVSYASLEDEIPALLGTKMLSGMLTGSGDMGNTAVEKMLRRAQRISEANAADRRRMLMDYDAVNNVQGTLFYEQRENVLKGVPDDFVNDMAVLTAYDVTEDSLYRGHIDPGRFRRKWLDIFGKPVTVSVNKKRAGKRAGTVAEEIVAEEAGTCPEMFRESVLRCMDWQWALHLERLDGFKEMTSFAGYGGRNPEEEYAVMAWRDFNGMFKKIRDDSVKLFLKTGKGDVS